MNYHLGDMDVFFEGRQECLYALSSVLSSSHLAQLVGEPKTGKSSIAMAFCRQCLATSQLYTGYFKLNCASVVVLQQECKEVLQVCRNVQKWRDNDLQPSEPVEELARATEICLLDDLRPTDLLEELVRVSKNCLLIFDNVLTFEVSDCLNKFLSCHSLTSDVIVISERVLFPDRPVIPVGNFTESDVITVSMKYLRTSKPFQEELSVKGEESVKRDLLQLAAILHFSPNDFVLALVYIRVCHVQTIGELIETLQGAFDEALYAIRTVLQ